MVRDAAPNHLTHRICSIGHHVRAVHNIPVRSRPLTDESIARAHFTFVRLSSCVAGRFVAIESIHSPDFLP